MQTPVKRRLDEVPAFLLLYQIIRFCRRNGQTGEYLGRQFMLLFIRQGGFWKSDVRIQITDLISGTLAYIYDSHKCSADAPDYLKILHNKIIRVELYSETYKTYTLENSAIADDYDEDIAQLCFAQAVKFVEHNADSPDPEIQAQIAVLQHLLFRFMNNDTRGYTYTYELKQQLSNTELRNLSDQAWAIHVVQHDACAGWIILPDRRHLLTAGKWHIHFVFSFSDNFINRVRIHSPSPP